MATAPRAARSRAYALLVAHSTPPPVSEILDARSGEQMVLIDRFLNPQMGRILRTLGFDKVWCRGEGAHLIDDHGHSAYVLALANKLHINSMSSSPNAHAGKRGDRILDEFALHSDPNQPN